MTKIEWVKSSDGSQGKTWNPIAGCTVLTPGCKRCYAMKMAARLAGMGQALYAGLTEQSKAGPVWTGVMRQASTEVLFAPLHRKKPTTWFVNSMSDLFHEDVPDEWIDMILAVMALTPHHTYQVLTKRSARMRAYYERIHLYRDVLRCADKIRFKHPQMRLGEIGVNNPRTSPLSNVWLGVSTERQQEANARIPDLLLTPAAVRFISAEPLLGPIDLTKILMCEGTSGEPDYYANVLTGDCGWEGEKFTGISRTLDWIIVGGESGAGARPMHPAWVRSIREQCDRHGALNRLFFKQWGSWIPICECPDDFQDSLYAPAPKRGPPDATRRCKVDQVVMHADGSVHRATAPNTYTAGSAAMLMYNVGKKRAGRQLDGVEHNSMPKVAV